MPVRPTLLHRMALVSFLLFRKNLGNLGEFFGQIVYRPPWQKIARTPMILNTKWSTRPVLINAFMKKRGKGRKKFFSSLHYPVDK